MTRDSEKGPILASRATSRHLEHDCNLIHLFTALVRVP